MSEDLEEVYRAYLRALDDRRLDDLDRFVHDRITYNDEPWTREQYRARLRQDAVAIPDLRYHADLLVTGEDHVACRLSFRCTPRGELFGIPVHGRRVAFAEHVFYRFRDARIEQVWSLIDLAAVRRQLGEDG